MNAVLQRFDPDLVQLLKEIAANPESVLLRHLRPLNLNTLYSHDSMGPMAPFLGSAERHLLDLYREQAGVLLHSMVRAKTLGLANGEANFVDHGTSGPKAIHSRQFPSTSKLRQELHRLESETRGQDPNLEWSLARALRAEASSTADILELAGLAQALLPHAYSCHVAACLLVWRRESEAAVQFVNGYSKCYRAPEDRVYEAVNLGFAQFALGHYGPAVRQYELSLHEESPLEIRLSLLLSSLLARDIGATRRILRVLNQNAADQRKSRAFIQRSVRNSQSFCAAQSLQGDINRSISYLEPGTRSQVEVWIHE